MTASNSIPPPRLWPLKEVLRQLGGVSRQTVSRAERANLIKLVRIGSRVFVADDELRRVAAAGFAAKGAAP